jgi:hypothetical protein
MTGSSSKLPAYQAQIPGFNPQKKKKKKEKRRVLE